MEELIRYLELTGAGRQGLLERSREDVFSGLRDEMYKTVTALQQTRDRARETKNMFAANLANIAHQMKTPVTAISLCIQRMKEKNTLEYLASVERQIDRLTHLEEALLLMSRMDAGALEFQKKEVDVFTVLEMAAENLEDLSFRKNTAFIDYQSIKNIKLFSSKKHLLIFAVYLSAAWIYFYTLHNYRISIAYFYFLKYRIPTIYFHDFIKWRLFFIVKFDNNNTTYDIAFFRTNTRYKTAFAGHYVQFCSILIQLFLTISFLSINASISYIIQNVF